MKNIIVFSKDLFFIKNFKEYILENNLDYKVYFFNDLKIEKDLNKIKKLVTKNIFTIVNIGLSGSIQFNIKNGQKIYNFNTAIYYRVITNLKKLNIKNLFFISASCTYPNNKKILNEKFYGHPPLENTSFFYSLTKIFGTNLCAQINKDKNFRYITIVPATLYGKYAKFHKVKSHVLTSLISKINNNRKKLILWGTGTPKREFIFIKDFIDAIFFINKNKIYKNIINVGTGKDYSIKDLVKKIKRIKNFNGNIIWDKSKKDGAKKKLLDSKFLFSKGWRPKLSLLEGIKEILNK